MQAMEEGYTGVHLAEREEARDGSLPDYESWMPRDSGMQDPEPTLLLQQTRTRRLTRRRQPIIPSQRGKLSGPDCLHNTRVSLPPAFLAFQSRLSLMEAHYIAVRLAGVGGRPRPPPSRAAPAAAPSTDEDEAGQSLLPYSSGSLCLAPCCFAFAAARHTL